MHFLTSFGDAIVVLPLAAIVLLWLLSLVGRRAALFWCWALLIAGGGTALLKIYLSVCASPGDALQSPSGHTSMSTLVYGGLGLIVGVETKGAPRVAAIVTSAALVAAVALTRVALGAHDGSEVAVGLAFGGTALGLFALGFFKDHPREQRTWPLVAAAAVMAVGLHGHPIELEPFWHFLGSIFRSTTGVCAA